MFASALTAMIGCTKPVCGDGCIGTVSTEEPEPAQDSDDADESAIKTESDSAVDTPAASSLNPVVNPTLVPLQACVDHTDCGESFPACSPISGTCVRCIAGFGCPSNKPQCDVAPDDAENRCIACEATDDCADGLVCVANECLACDPTDARGCADGQVCWRAPTAPGGAPQCVDCAKDDDCEVGVCLDFECQACDSVTHAGCSEPTKPYCTSPALDTGPRDAGVPDASVAQSGEYRPVCVECLKDTQCNSGVCENGACTTCRPESNAGCNDATLPICISLQLGEGSNHEDASSATPGPSDGETARRANTECVECADDGDCASESPYCIDHTCQVCAPSVAESCGAERPFCREFPTSSATDRENPTYDCVQCTKDEHCGDGRCVEDECVECTEDAHCNNASAPRCSDAHSCIGCESDTDCDGLPGMPACEPTSGSCVGCTEDTHCDASSSHPVCYAALNTCVECTQDNFQHCPSQTCRTLPGPQHNTCLQMGTQSPQECSRCSPDDDCGPAADCVEHNGEYRCLVRAETDAGVGCNSQTYELPDFSIVEYCVPEGC